MRYRAVRPLQHPRHRALGQRPHPDRLLLLAQHRHRRPSTPAKGAFILGALIVVVVGRSSLDPLPARAGEPRRGGALDGGARRQPPGSSPSAAATSRRLRFVWDRLTPGGTFGLEFTSADGGPRGRALRPDRLHSSSSAATRARRPATRPRSTSPNTSAAGFLHRPRQGHHLPRLRRLRLAAWPSVCAAALGLRAALDRGLRPARRDGLIVSSASHEIKDAVDRPRPPDRLVGTSRLLLPQRPRRPLGVLRLAGGDDRRCACGRGWRGRRWSSSPGSR